MTKGILDEPSLVELFGNKVRVRTCGLCWEEDKLLLVNHYGLYDHDFWSPPGGGLEFGLSAGSNLEKEFAEETGLVISIGDFLFACEFIREPLHAVELFFSAERRGGILISGSDPELGERQMIRAAKYFSEKELEDVPESHKHGIFRIAKSMEKIRGLRGYLKI